MSDELIVEELSGKEGHIGRLTLNRPEALNALTENMCLEILQVLKTWEKTPELRFVIIKGAGEKAFCAGGDIRQIYLKSKNSTGTAEAFFKLEYAMNKALFHFKKPYLSFLNGITMGGGVGVSMHGSHRIATEKLRLAMPETAIGFYPDIGAGYHLVRCPKKWGWYLALTGNAIGAAEAMHLGLATHFVKSSDLPALENALIASADIDALADFTQEAPPALLKEDDIIEKCFTAQHLEEALAHLDTHDAFAKMALDALNQRSPTSLKVTWEHLKHCETFSFDEVITENYAMTLNFLKGHDFLEGVRAQIIDKDKDPKWMPATLSEITSTEVSHYFK